MEKMRFWKKGALEIGRQGEFVKKETWRLREKERSGIWGDELKTDNDLTNPELTN